MEEGCKPRRIKIPRKLSSDSWRSVELSKASDWVASRLSWFENLEAGNEALVSPAH